MYSRLRRQGWKLGMVRVAAGGHQVLQGSSRLGPWEANQAIGFVRASCVCVIFFLGGGSGSGWGRLNGTRAARLR
jgi:hypothetical protein